MFDLKGGLYYNALSILNLGVLISSITIITKVASKYNFPVNLPVLL